MCWEGGVRGGGGLGIQKPIKKCHEVNITSPLTGPNNSLKKAKKLGVFLLSSLTLWLHCSKETQGLGEGGLTPIRGVLLTSTSSLKWCFLLLSELLRYQNSRITCPI